MLDKEELREALLREEEMWAHVVATPLRPPAFINHSPVCQVVTGGQYKKNPCSECPFYEDKVICLSLSNPISRWEVFKRTSSAAEMLSVIRAALKKLTPKMEVTFDDFPKCECGSRLIIGALRVCTNMDCDLD